MEWIVIVVFALLCLAWESQSAGTRKRQKEAYIFNAANAHGAAAFAGNKDLKGLFKGKGVAIGYSPDGRHALHYPGFGHILTIAAARTGKDLTLLVNALLSWRYSVVVIDPKCENAAITGHWRKRFGKTFVLNPFGMLSDALKGLKQAHINPMDIL